MSQNKQTVDLNELKKKLEQLQLQNNQKRDQEDNHDDEQSDEDIDMNQYQQQQKQEFQQLLNRQKNAEKKIQHNQLYKANHHNYQNQDFDFEFNNLQISDFILHSTLGTGTFGRVRLVKFKADPSSEVYALKILKKTEIVRLNQVDHIKSEKQILSKTNHPFIVSMKGCFQDEKYVYMLFEFISGGELFSRLRKDGRFANDIALFYTCEIILSIQYLHKQGIVYRDLKPENLLIDKEGHIKITDFGFAKVLENDRTYTLCGTPEYLAPEIIKGSKVGYGKSVDWWALGILVFEMLSGYPPFYDNEPIGIYKKIVAGIIEFPRFFSIRVKDIIRKLLNPDLNYRLGVADNGESIMKHKWFKGVDWQMVYRREIPAPWTPYLKNNEDVSWFEKYPDSKDTAKNLPKELYHLFEDF